MDDMASHVRDALARVKFNPDRSNPMGATLQFFADVMTALRRNRISHATEDASKAIISQLVDMLNLSLLGR